MFRYLEKFREKDLTSYRFRDELYFKTKDSLEEIFADSKTNAIDYAKVHTLSDFVLDIFKLGVEIGEGKSYEDFQREAKEQEERTNKMLSEMGII